MGKISRTVLALARANDRRAWLRHFIKRHIFYHRSRNQNIINRAFDERFGTDTASEIPLSETGLPASSAARGNTIYRTLWEADFRFVLDLMAFELDSFTFVDIGSGKGKLLMLAAEYSFKHIVGVEYSPGLHAIASANLLKYSSKTQLCNSIKLVLSDALDYNLPSGALICLIFNSFDLETMVQFLERLDRQTKERSEPMFVIYANVRTVTEIGDVFKTADSLVIVYNSDRHLILCNAAALALWRGAQSGPRTMKRALT